MAAAALGVALLAALCGCAATQNLMHRRAKGSKLSLTVRATNDLNNCGTAVAYPLHYVLVQVTDAAPLTGMTVEGVWGKWASLPGGVFISAGPEIVIEPGATKSEEPVSLDPRAGAVVVVGNFCKSSGSCFYHVLPVEGKKIRLGLTADSTCFAASPY